MPAAAPVLLSLALVAATGPTASALGPLFLPAALARQLRLRRSHLCVCASPLQELGRRRMNCSGSGSIAEVRLKLSQGHWE